MSENPGETQESQVENKNEIKPENNPFKTWNFLEQIGNVDWRWWLNFKPMTREQFNEFKSKVPDMPAWVTFEKFNEFFLQITKELKEKYWLDESNIAEVTADEWKEFNSKLLISNNQVDTTVKFVYEEVIETKVHDEKMKAVSIDNVTTWIKNDRLTNAKKAVNDKLDEQLRQYDFLWDRKEMVKLVILDKIIQNPAAQRVKNYLESITNLFKDPSKVLTEWTSIISEGNSVWKDVKDMVDNIIKPYTDLLDKINKKLSDHELWKNTDTYLTSEQKRKLISHIDFFNDPTKLEWGFNADDILKQMDDLLADPNKFNNSKELTDEDKKKLVEYMLVSREHIESTLNDLQKWDKLKDMALNVAWLNWPIWKMWKWIIEFLLKIPILWGIIASFLWLDPERAVDDFNEQILTHKTLKALKTFWIQKDKDWNKIKDWEKQFEWIDLSAINHNETKNELKRVNEFKNSITVPAEETKNKTEESKKDDKKEDKKPETPTTKPKFEKDTDFWKEAFSAQWIDKDWSNLKFEITNEQKKDWITSEEFNKIIEDWFDAFEAGKTKKDNADKKEKEDKKNQETTSKIQWLETEIKWLNEQLINIDKVLKWEYKNNEKWSSLLPFWWSAINWIKIQDILNNHNNDFNSILNDKLSIAEQSDSTNTDALTENYRKIFNLFFSLIKDFYKENKIIPSTETLQVFLNSKWYIFNEFINNNITKLVEEKTHKEKELKWLQATLTSTVPPVVETPQVN